MADSKLVYNGGYDCEFVETVPKDLYCPLCKRVATEPRQLTCCGRILCTSCGKKFSQQQRMPLPCPQCGKEWRSFYDKKSAQNILALQVKCPNSNKECDWIGELKEQENHKKQCKYEYVDCENKCYNQTKVTRIYRKDLKKHLKEKCPKRRIDCQHCGIIGEHWDITGKHLEECPKVLVECYNEGCKEMVERCDLSQSGLHASKCKYTMIECKYVDFGCKEFARKDLPDHESDLNYHFEMVCKTVRSVKERLNALEESSQFSKIERAEISDKVKSFDQIKGKKLSFSNWFAVRRGISKDDPALDEPGIVVATFKMKDFLSYRINKKTFHSPTFYTYRNGYKMKVRVQPINDKLSIYVEVIPGENDSNLKWPVDEMKIEVQLLNQDLDNHHYSNLICFENEKGNFSEQPIYISKGFEDAIPITKLTEEYASNDTLFFRVTVYKAWTGTKPWLVCSASGINT